MVYCEIRIVVVWMNISHNSLSPVRLISSQKAFSKVQRLCLSNCGCNRCSCKGFKRDCPRAMHPDQSEWDTCEGVVRVSVNQRETEM